MLQINWFPGHMAKTLRQLREQSNRCDYMIELSDARLSASSRNPVLDDVLQRKPRMLLLTKADLADPAITEQWTDRLGVENTTVLAADLRQKKDIKRIRNRVLQDNRKLIEQAKAKGRRIRPIRVMISGIPNTGKSTLINALIGKKSAQVSNRPGVTRAIQWLRAGNDLELMDTPGVLWPKFDTLEERFALAASGAIKDDLIPQEEIAGLILLWLQKQYPDHLTRAFKVADFTPETNPEIAGYTLLTEAALKNNLLLSGGEPDRARMARKILTDVRRGAAGRVSLEIPGCTWLSDAAESGV